MDRIALLGDPPRYRMKDGELVKGMRVPGLRYHMIGVGDKLSEAEQKAFLSLHAETERSWTFRVKPLSSTTDLTRARLSRSQRRSAMNRLEIMLLCASPPRRKGTSAMLLERVRKVTGGEVVFLPQRSPPQRVGSDNAKS